jgi:hypothetical protein
MGDISMMRKPIPQMHNTWSLTPCQAYFDGCLFVISQPKDSSRSAPTCEFCTLIFLCHATSATNAPPLTHACHCIDFHRYQTILPMVQQQVSAQIKVRDLSAAKLSIAPADATSWSEVRTELLSEAKSKLRAELETALSCASPDRLDKIRTDFTEREAKLEHSIDSETHTFSATIDIE